VYSDYLLHSLCERRRVDSAIEVGSLATPPFQGSWPRCSNVSVRVA
jgi:hypothetical protein